MATHKDAVGRKIELGDLVAMSSTYGGAMYIHIVAGFSNKGISALTYFQPDIQAGGAKFLERSLKRAKESKKVCAGWSTGGWDGYWSVGRRLIKLNPEDVFDEKEMEIFNQVKAVLHGEERAEVEGVHL